MEKPLFLLASMFVCISLSNAQPAGPDKSLYPNLPDPMITNAGQRVQDITTWENTRSDEILKIFTEEVYGRSPQPGDYTTNFSVVSTTSIANETAVRKMVQISVTGPNGTHTFQVPVYLPNKAEKVPVFILINHRTPISGTSSTIGFFPLDSVILPRGYGAAVINDVDVADDNPKYREGIIDEFNMNDPNDWKMISAWAFAASRLIDYLETDPDVDVSRIAVIGHSRGGKASLWTGVQDKRIALTCVNDAGCTGDRLMKGSWKWGETIEQINGSFPHWFATKYRDSNGQDKNLPFDFHQLVTLIAPRLIAQGTASGDDWADPVAQFHSLVFAQPVFALYGKTTTTWQTSDAPNKSKPIVMRNGNIQAHQRIGEHDLKEEDWNNYLDFADKQRSIR